jgi:transketolase
MRDVFVETLLEEARNDQNIILITGDLGFGVLDKFQNELPNQFINAGVNEQAMMGMAAGIASTGKRVFVYSIGNFPTLRCIEQIRNDVCLMNNPVVVVAVGAGYAYGPQGYTHHSLEDIAVMRALPNIEIISPADPCETRAITQYLANTRKPAYLRLGKSNEKVLFQNNLELQPGKANNLLVGDEGSILFTGSIGVLAIEAAKKLNAKGVSVSVTSIPFITDLDVEYLQQAAALGPIVTLEEHSIRGGFGSAILELMSTRQISARIGLVTASQIAISQIGSQDFLRNANGLNVQEILVRFNSLKAMK